MQTRHYMARMVALEGHLVIFDVRDPAKAFVDAQESLVLGQGFGAGLFRPQP